MYSPLGRGKGWVMSSLIAMKICCQDLQKIGNAPMTLGYKPAGNEAYVKFGALGFLSFEFVSYFEFGCSQRMC